MLGGYLTTQEINNFSEVRIKNNNSLPETENIELHDRGDSVGSSSRNPPSAGSIPSPTTAGSASVASSPRRSNNPAYAPWPGATAETSLSLAGTTDASDNGSNNRPEYVFNPQRPRPSLLGSENAQQNSDPDCCPSYCKCFNKRVSVNPNLPKGIEIDNLRTFPTIMKTFTFGLGITAFCLGLSGILNTTHPDRWKDTPNSDCALECPKSWTYFETCFIVLSAICMMSSGISVYLGPTYCLLIPQHRCRDFTVQIVTGFLSLTAAVSIFQSTNIFSPRSSRTEPNSAVSKEELVMFHYLEKKIAGFLQFTAAMCYLVTAAAIVFEPYRYRYHIRPIRRVNP